MTLKRSDPEKTVLLVLEELGGRGTTEEIIKLAEEWGLDECRDGIPGSLQSLRRKGKIDRSISKEKKAIVWTLP